MIVTYLMDWLKVIVCCWVGQVFFCIISVVPRVCTLTWAAYSCKHTLR